MNIDASDTLTARVALLAASDPRGMFDGAWWPRSRDFATEVPSLLRALREHGQYTRATVDLALWPGTPRPFALPGLGRIFRWGGFTTGADPHRVMLYCLGGTKELLVIPPEASPTAAARLMTAACSPHETRSATQLLHDTI